MNCPCNNPDIVVLGEHTGTINGKKKTYVEKYCKNCKAQWSEEK